MDLDAVRQKLASATGPRFWRSLEEVADTPEFQDTLKHEFPAGVDVFTDPVGRRKFLSLMGASLALAGVTGCTRQPRELIMPYAAEPPEMIPGVPRMFATSMPFSGVGEPVLVESHENRPTKIEGNPEHPMSQGASGVFAQASILNMYDPDRLPTPQQRGRSSSWLSFRTELRRQMALARGKQGAGLRILTPTVGSPTLAAKLQALTTELPQAKWVQWEPVNRDNQRAGAVAAFGRDLSVRYDLSKAKVVLALDSDFLSTNGPGSVAMIKAFARGRKVENGNVSGMNRLYVVEANATATGSNADHRLRLKSSDVAVFVGSLASALGVAGTAAGELSEKAKAWIEPLAADLRANQGAAVVIVGDQQPAWVHAAAHAINAQLGAFGGPAIATEPVLPAPSDQLKDFAALVAEMASGVVETLVILDSNPVYNAPADVDFAAALEKVPFRIQLASHHDETGELCHWQLPLSNFLEAWGDIRALDGTLTLQQPLIEPIFQSKSELELVGLMMGDERSAYDQLQEVYAQAWGLSGEAFEAQWRKALHDGMVANSASAPVEAGVVAEWANAVARPAASAGLELVIRPDSSAWDGRYNNNGWLQELPRPISRLTWDNVAAFSPATATKMTLRNGDIVTLGAAGNKVEAPVWVLPGLADDVCVVTLGYGREMTGRVGTGVGFNAYKLQSTEALWTVANLDLAKRGKTTELACVQDHYSMEGRNLVRIANAQEYAAHPGFAQEGGHGGGGHEAPGHGGPYLGKLTDEDGRREGAALFESGKSQGLAVADVENPLSVYPESNYSGYAWGMTIDLNSCVGCNACMAACNSENNIPVIGKEQVSKGREMHWIRLDRYFEGDEDDPAMVNQPLTCMQCENAPCEPVCPVGATVHSNEGLNDMVYNRCVGTRYCSNNCPYKVRRFNFLLYQDFTTETLKMSRNPDVTVRSRGVMEKCTYCVQRINVARIKSEREGRAIADGEIQTACQQACPAEAIVFGNINDDQSQVSKLKGDSRNYALLEELNTQPRTSYLARVRNINPDMPATSTGADAHAEA
ncbi:MAG: TAT-variant-translocated molybdopterin oxidoreductase [Bryobacterales bacterium]|nr:TAT-variant-translocated molybdopterin oxidoreductase [Bryobacterales bacterium]